MSHELVFLENRRTPKVVSKGDKYEPTEAEGKITKRRAATEDEEKTIARGDWVRVNEQGDKPSDSGYKRKKSKVRPSPHTNAGHTSSFGLYKNTIFGQYVTLRSSDEGYEGVTHAGIAMVAADTGRVLLAQRAMDEDDDPGVQETWEFPGGGLGDGEHPWAGALREFTEEVGTPPEGEVVDGWRSPDGVYQGFVYLVPTEVDFGTGADPEEVQAVTWMTQEQVESVTAENLLRPEVREHTPWDKVWGAVSGNEEESLVATPEIKMDDPEGDLDAMFDLDGPIPVHGVLAIEDGETGDKRLIGAGAMTRRPLRLPLSYQRESNEGHSKSIVVGAIDRIMRKGGLIHWEGELMESDGAEELAGLIGFFGRFGLSVDGDKLALSETESERRGLAFVESIRAAGATAVHIPAFHEAYVAFGPHPEMPHDEEPETLAASAFEGVEVFGTRSDDGAFKRGPGWVTNPRETKRLHDYWTKKGEPGYAKINWGVGGDFRRCRVLVGEKIAKNSPTKARYMNQICAQWHHDALGYWPGELGKPGNNPKRLLAGEAVAFASDFDNDDITRVEENEETGETEAVWEAVLVSDGSAARPPIRYFHRQEDGGALTISEPDEQGFRHVYGYAAEWGVCHLGFDGRCVEAPRTYSDDYPDFHLGRTRVEGGYVPTGVLTYGVGHRDADTILSESPEQAYYDNINNAWAAVRMGEDERGIWFSGVVLPGVPEDHITKIEASGQVSGEWKGESLRACLTVNVPGFGVQRSSATYDEFGNVTALAASAFAANAEINGVETSECSETGPKARMAALAAIDAETRMDALRERFKEMI